MKLHQTLSDLRADSDAREAGYPCKLPTPLREKFWEYYVAMKVVMLSFIDDNTEHFVSKYARHGIRGVVFANLSQTPWIERDVLSLMLEFCEDAERIEANIGEQLPNLMKQFEQPSE